jgi:Immunity protein 31
MTGPTPRFRYYEVVVVRITPETCKDQIAGKRGAVMGISLPEANGRPVTYAIGSYDFDETYVVSEDELDPTGKIDRRDDFYSGESMRVSQEGELPDE